MQVEKAKCAEPLSMALGVKFPCDWDTFVHRASNAQSPPSGHLGKMGEL